jgi:hypothetical protein
MSKKRGVCSLEDCLKPHYGRNYCQKHYWQVKRHGRIVQTQRDPRPAIIENGVARIPLGVFAKAGYAIVDEKFSHLDKFNWHKSCNGYAITRIDGKSVFLHHLVLPREKGLYTDHINRDRLDNREVNLRNVDYFINNQNIGIQNNNKSGIVGISWDKARQKWAVDIMRFEKRYRLGRFNTLKEAKAEKEMFFNGVKIPGWK